MISCSVWAVASIDAASNIVALFSSSSFFLPQTKPASDSHASDIEFNATVLHADICVYVSGVLNINPSLALQSSADIKACMF